MDVVVAVDPEGNIVVAPYVSPTDLSVTKGGWTKVVEVISEDVVLVTGKLEITGALGGGEILESQR